MPFIGTQKTLPTLPPVVIQPMVSSSVSVVFGKKRYELSDWLGNVRVVINDRKTPVNSGVATVGYKAQVINVNDYYSYGSTINERTYDYSSTKFRFAFNDKELDNEVYGFGNFQDYGARMYNTRLGRFISADPIIITEKKYPWYSSYQFAGNKPINSIDLDGKEEEAKIYMYEQWDKTLAKLQNRSYEEVHLENQIRIGKLVAEQVAWELVGMGAGRLLSLGAKGLVHLWKNVQEVNLSLYRVFGGEALHSGKYYTFINPKLYGKNYSKFAGLPSSNSAAFTIKVKTPVKNIDFKSFGLAKPIGRNIGRLVPEVKIKDISKVEIMDFKVNKYLNPEYKPVIPVKISSIKKTN
jgi:RHS repeat-associated protein